MSQTKTLLEIEYHTDSETGIHDIGEIDCGIHVRLLDDYLRRYGVKGKNEIILMLAKLIHKVEECFEDAQRKRPL